MRAIEAQKQRQYEGTAGFYEAERYHELPHMAFYLEYRAHTISKAIRERFPSGCPNLLIEVGCGTGVNLPFWRKEFPRAAVVGLDLTMAMLRRAQQKTCHLTPAILLSQASCFSLPFADASVDALVATRFIHQFPHKLKKAFYEELRRVVRPGGVIAIEFYARPYARLHYLFPRSFVWWRKEDAPQNAPASEYFSHYPTRAEVREIVGMRFNRLPVRPAFCRLAFKLLGHKWTWGLTQMLRYDPLGLLYSEYVVVSQA